MTDLTQIELITLAALSDRARYGYELVQRISELTEGRLELRPGNLYRVLQRLMDRDLAREVEGRPDEDERRRYFRATAQGCRVAAEELGMYRNVLERAPALKERLAHE